MKKEKIIAPKHLSLEAKETWNSLICEYEIFNSAGLKILCTALESFDRAACARKQINRDGMMLKGKFGQIKPHPLLPIERDSRAAFLNALKMLRA